MVKYWLIPIFLIVYALTLNYFQSLEPVITSAYTLPAK